MGPFERTIQPRPRFPDAEIRCCCRRRRLSGALHGQAPPHDNPLLAGSRRTAKAAITALCSQWVRWRHAWITARAPTRVSGAYLGAGSLDAESLKMSDLIRFRVDSARASPAYWKHPPLADEARAIHSRRVNGVGIRLAYGAPPRRS